MSKIKDGGPAFPHNGDYVDGMTLRDFFASQVSTDGYEFAREVVAELESNMPEDDDFIGMLNISARMQACIRYAIADAMLAEREREGGK